MIPAEFYCLQLLIKHALKESKSLKSFASTKQLPYYPNCNSDGLSVSIHCNSAGTTTEKPSLRPSSRTYVHAQATGDPIQGNPVNRPKNLLSVDKLPQLSILTVFHSPQE